MPKKQLLACAAAGALFQGCDLFGGDKTEETIPNLDVKPSGEDQEPMPSIEDVPDVVQQIIEDSDLPEKVQGLLNQIPKDVEKDLMETKDKVVGELNDLLKAVNTQVNSDHQNVFKDLEAKVKDLLPKDDQGESLIAGIFESVNKAINDENLVGSVMNTVNEGFKQVSDVFTSSALEQANADGNLQPLIKAAENGEVKAADYEFIFSKTVKKEGKDQKQTVVLVESKSQSKIVINLELISMANLVKAVLDLDAEKVKTLPEEVKTLISNLGEAYGELAKKEGLKSFGDKSGCFLCKSPAKDWSKVDAPTIKNQNDFNGVAATAPVANLVLVNDTKFKKHLSAVLTSVTEKKAEMTVAKLSTADKKGLRFFKCLHKAIEQKIAKDDGKKTSKSKAKEDPKSKKGDTSKDASKKESVEKDSKTEAGAKEKPKDSA